MRVLLVDDSERFLESTKRWIQSRHDLELVGTASTGVEALDAVARLRPDLVIVEAALTGMDGFRVARQLKIKDASPLVLLVSFYPSVAARNEAFAAGADAFLAKDDFSDEIESILERWRAARPVEDQAPAARARRELRDVPEA
ncbi:MAG TPA: response regulator transcription factor [Candidatus Polarisedimenticolaceae bacterium]|nr:response regulator transcription factor [Candidatus Polarisedimenticolaceae bacterium]